MGQDFFTTLRESGKALADLLMPRYCITCGQRLGIYEQHLCIWCWGDFPFTRNWTEVHNHMSDRFNELLVEKEPEGRTFQYAAALFFYQEHNNDRKITQAIKYKADFSAGRFFGRLLGERLSASWGRDADLVVPIPLHWTRKLSRGYNQAAVSAGALAEALGIPMEAKLLVRARKTRTQTQLDTEEKQRNVDGAFIVNPHLSRKQRLRLAKTKHVILFDDVFTTGATMCSAYMALRGIFPLQVRISAVTLGCVQHF